MLIQAYGIVPLLMFVLRNTSYAL